jgi:hypothetical protein
MRKNRPLSSLARFLPLLVSSALLAGEEENPILELIIAGNAMETRAMKALCEESRQKAGSNRADHVVATV